MSFRRYVGRVVRIVANGADGALRQYVSRLFSYDDSGLWIHHRDTVDLPDGQQKEADGFLFLPMVQIVSVFACDELTRFAPGERDAEGSVS